MIQKIKQMENSLLYKSNEIVRERINWNFLVKARAFFFALWFHKFFQLYFQNPACASTANRKRKCIHTLDLCLRLVRLYEAPADGVDGEDDLSRKKHLKSFNVFFRPFCARQG